VLKPRVERTVVPGETEDPQLAKMRGLPVKVRARKFEAALERGQPVIFDTSDGLVVWENLSEAEAVAKVEALNASHVGAALALGWRLL
jgi:hypothetical protein